MPNMKTLDEVAKDILIMAQELETTDPEEIRSHGITMTDLIDEYVDRWEARHELKSED